MKKDSLEGRLKNWLNSPQFLKDKRKYESSVDTEVKWLIKQVYANENAFIFWYAQAKPSDLHGKTPYEYTKKNGLKYVKQSLNGLMSPPAT